MELSLFLHAGMDAASGLSLLAEEDGELKSVAADMARRMDEGSTLTTAFQSTERFPEYVCGLVRVGEETGHLEECLQALAGYYEHRMRLDRQLRSALLYPAVLMLVMLAMLVVLLTRVLPVFDDVYASLGGRLTGVAGGLLTLGRALDAVMPLLCVLLAVAVALLAAFAGSRGFRTRVLAIWRKRFGDSGVSRKLNAARFAQALSMCVRSGLQMEDALPLAGVLLEDIPSARQRCEDCVSRLERGVSSAHAMSEAGLLPPSECRLLEIGMRSGCQDSVMPQIAERLAEEGDEALEHRMSQIEPAMVVTASVLVGVILLSVMLPLMHIMAAIG